MAVVERCEYGVESRLDEDDEETVDADAIYP
jgi:hypothetical protein